MGSWLPQKGALIHPKIGATQLCLLVDIHEASNDSPIRQIWWAKKT